MSRIPKRQWQNAKEIRDCICHQGIICTSACESHHHEGCVSDVNYVMSDAEKSERAIARERHKRRVEKQVEINLRETSEPREQSSTSVFSGLGFHLDVKPAERKWICPIGVSSR